MLEPFTFLVFHLGNFDTFLFSGPGLAIRVICAEQAYKEKSFSETASMLRAAVDFHNLSTKVCEISATPLTLSSNYSAVWLFVEKLRLQCVLCLATFCHAKHSFPKS